MNYIENTEEEIANSAAYAGSQTIQVSAHIHPFMCRVSTFIFCIHSYCTLTRGDNMSAFVRTLCRQSQQMCNYWFCMNGYNTFVYIHSNNPSAYIHTTGFNIHSLLSFISWACRDNVSSFIFSVSIYSHIWPTYIYL
jgi:hypothetical protein